MQVRSAQAVGIWGVGGVGAHAVRLARMMGAAPIIAVDPLPNARASLRVRRRPRARPGRPGFADAVLRATDGLGLDYAFASRAFPGSGNRRRPSSVTAVRWSLLVSPWSR